MIKKHKKIKIPEMTRECLAIETYGHADIANHMDLMMPDILNDARKNNLEKLSIRHGMYIDTIRKFCQQNTQYRHVCTQLGNDSSTKSIPLLIDKSIDKIFIIFVDVDQNSPNIWLKPIISKNEPDNNLYFINKDDISMTLVEKQNRQNSNKINIEGFENIWSDKILPNVIRQKVLLEGSLNMDEMERLEEYCENKDLDLNEILFRDDETIYSKQIKSQKLLERIYPGDSSEISYVFNNMIMEMSTKADSKWVSIYEKFANKIVNSDTLSDFEKIDVINRNSLLYVNIQTFPKFAHSINENVLKLTEYLVKSTLLTEEFSTIRTLKSILEYNIEIIKKSQNPEVNIEDMVKLLETSMSLVDERVDAIKKNITDDIILYNRDIVKDVEMQLESLVVDTIFEKTDAFSQHTVSQLMLLSNILENHHNNSIMLEGKIGDSVRKATTKAAQSSEKAANSLRKAGSDLKRNLGPINKIPEPFVKMFNNTVNKLKSMDAKERRERIITGNYKFKLLNYIKKTILFIASGKIIIAAAGGAGASLVGPLLWAIGAIASIAINKNLDRKERKKILFELESELDIVKEKIEDAKGDNNRNNKYELMRIQKKLEKDILRIKYHLKE